MARAHAHPHDHSHGEADPHAPIEEHAAYRDESLLLRWFDRAVSMATAEEVFAPLETTR